MAADGNSSDNEMNEIKQEPLPEETSYVFAPDKLFESSDSPPPEPLGQDKGAACDAPVASTREEKDPQALTDDRETKHVPRNSSEENAGNGNVFSSLSFPKKLWQLAESDEFKAIWWGHSGNYIVIDEEMFKVEVLGRTRPPRVFETESMKSFIRQLNLYGFTTLQQDLQRSPSLPEFPKEEDAFSDHRKILYYYNPNFKRDSPHLLKNCKQRVALKRKALQAGLDESCPSSSLYAQPGWRDADMDEEDPLAAAPEEDTQPAAPAGSPLPKHWAKATPQASGAHTASQGAAPTLPDPAAAAGRDKQQRLDPSLLLSNSSQTSAAAPAPSPHHVLPSQIPLCPNAGAPKAPSAALPPFGHPLFPVALLAAASAMAMLQPPNWQPLAAPHCPTCTCDQDRAAAGDRMAP
ncbi:heat shock transcription factor, Y-linked-like [Cygnus olor]|uniref:heat shock transcription factor, Y-linked-like n=1 Tax=Cygnus olor TaxID=8869 RepID=UPI001ADE9F20|nr:heat shock transcription factor, Y-linked-like [Cygnus olor]XP_040416641.1 heat shock transcription factor, Y-linked-like [Cygnus olor]